MPAECEYKQTQCPYRHYHHNHGLRCKDDCSMKHALKIQEDWKEKYQCPSKSPVVNPLASIALNAASAPREKV